MIRRQDLKKWNKSSESLPNEGVLCVIFYPVGEYLGVGLEDKTLSGHIALVYYREANGWVYADGPLLLAKRWSDFQMKKSYWMPFDKINVN